MENGIQMGDDKNTRRYEITPVKNKIIHGENPANSSVR